MKKLLLLSVCAASLLALRGAVAQDVPNVSSPPQIALSANAVATGQVWTAAQWNAGFKQKKNVLTFYGTTTTDATHVLTTDGDTPTSSNVGSFPSNIAVLYTSNCLIRNIDTGGMVTYSQAPTLTVSVAGVVSDSAGNPSGVAGPDFGVGMPGISTLTISADNTNKGLYVAYGPPVGNVNTIEAKCVVEIISAQ